ncbi:hypothetical protein I3843_05G212600 [Carya illinoinensis]|uniref:Uncharacterized protein n=2 Tax=Carya illinoinensis TaxID=32201 RepID=A0A8T1QMT9_CARIL|nr:uncharacterized protein LOC122309620 isoform X1 [Carya illinoinensis]KAG6655745.1 hypothetical protein CIPAW_05G237300 [Carya illinoinensis]KAG6715032.1 hypothetical protein I3842_05G230000 [Carya illinoinensis]KAG7981044.1 hypothetical protein I3843_05G212600 [Carya illinoinensis]
MDFHSLARKELQALCKKNKIPANITNVAMADALHALQHVEGLEEILNPSNSVLSKSTGEAVIGLPDIPRTACRTSTRRKPIKEESEISQTLTRSRRGTNGRIPKDIDQENNDANAPITPAGPNSRRRAPAASACRNIEKQLREDDENEKIEAQGRNDVPKTPAITSSRRRAPNAPAHTKLETQNGDTSVQRVYSTRRSVRLLEQNMEKLSIMENGKEEPAKADDLFEEPSNTSQRPEVSVELEKNISGVNKQTRSEVDSEKNDDSEVSSDPKSIGSPETGRESEVDVKDKDKSDDEYEVDVLKSKQELGTRISDDLGVVEASNAIDEALNEGSDESFNISSEKLEAVIDVNFEAVNEKGPADVPITEQDIGSIGFEGVKVPMDVSAEALNHVIASKSLQPEHNIDPNLVQDECQNLTCKDSDMHVAEVDDIGSSDSEFTTEGNFDGDIASDESSTDCEDNISDEDATTVEKDPEASVLPEDQVMDGFRKLETKTEFLVDVKKSKEESDQLATEYNSADGLDWGGDMTIDNDSPSESFVAQQLEMQVSIEFAEKVSLTGEYIKAPRPPVQSPVSSMEVYDSETLVDVHKDSSLLCSATKTSKEGTPFHTDHPMSKVQESIQSETMNVNKDVMLETMSLRKLRQMLIQQSKGNSKGKIVTKEQLGKKRIALQTLQENCLAVEESDKREYEVHLSQ